MKGSALQQPIGRPAKQHKKKRSPREIRRTIGNLFKILLLLAAGAAILYLLIFHCYKKAVTTRCVSLTADEDRQTEAFGEAYLCYSGRGLSVVNSRGKNLFSQSVVMENPRLMLREGYGALGDIEGDSLVIFNQKKVTGTIELAYPLLDFDVSRAGVVALAVDEGTTTRICYYDRTGSPLDVELTLELSLSGYPLELALSPDGQGLVLSCVTARGGVLTSRLCFYDMSAGSGQSEPMTGYFSYENELFPAIRYLNDSAVLAAGTEGLRFFTLDGDEIPSLKREILTDGTLQALATREERVLTAVTDSSGAGVYRIYDAAGACQLVINNSEERLSCGLTEKGLWLLTPEGLRVWNGSGRLRFSGELEGGSGALFMTGRLRALQWSADSLRHYRLSGL